MSKYLINKTTDTTNIQFKKYNMKNDLKKNK